MRNHQRLKAAGAYAAFAVALAVISIVLKVTLGPYSENPPYRDLLSALYNLYYVPILIAAFFWGEAAGVTVGAWAIVALLFNITDGRFLTESPEWNVWWPASIAGCFYLAIGYMAGRLASRVRASGREWHSLLEVSRSINSSLHLDDTLLAITRLSVELTSADACAIRLISDGDDMLVYARTFGLSDRYLGKGPLTTADSPLLKRALEGHELTLVDVRRNTDLPYHQEMLDEGIVVVLSLPLRVGERVIGLLNLYRKSVLGFTSRDRRVALAFAEQAASAIQNARLYDSIRGNYLSTLRALMRAIEARDPVTLGHSERVAAIAHRLARALKLSPADVEMLDFGAMLHDIGKIGLDEQTLAKSGHLTVDERLLMEMHPMIGKSIIEPVEFLRPAIPVVFSHHERWDGQGYPEGMQGTDIPLSARIIAVADALDHEMYRTGPFPVAEVEALEQVRAQAGSRLDPHLVAVLGRVIHGADAGREMEGAPIG